MGLYIPAGAIIAVTLFLALLPFVSGVMVGWICGRAMRAITLWVGVLYGGTCGLATFIVFIIIFVGSWDTILTAGGIISTVVLLPTSSAILTLGGCSLWSRAFGRYDDEAV